MYIHSNTIILTDCILMTVNLTTLRFKVIPAHGADHQHTHPDAGVMPTHTLHTPTTSGAGSTQSGKGYSKIDRELHNYYHPKIY
jgi:hypothetical protein